jgi:hypothetical protein
VIACKLHRGPLFLALLVALGVAACAGRRERPVDWHEYDAYSGWVVDAATGEPIESTVVVAAWEIVQWHFFHGSSRKIVHIQETVTDREGRFSLAPLGDYTPPLGWEREAHFPILAFFKPGYDWTTRQRFTWEYGEDAELLTKPNPRNVGWQREIQLYRYLTTPKRSTVIDHSLRPGPSEQQIINRLRGLASFLSRNAQDSYREEAAIEAQWRAILMVDAELRRYQTDYPQYSGYYWQSWWSKKIQLALREAAKKNPAR